MSQDEPCPVNPNILGGGGARASLGQSLPSAETSTVTQADSQDNVVGFPSAVPLPWSLVALSLLSHPPTPPRPPLVSCAPSPGLDCCRAHVLSTVAPTPGQACVLSGLVGPCPH